LLFSLGVIGTGLLALPVLGGSAAYAVGEALLWQVQKNDSHSKVDTAPRQLGETAAELLLRRIAKPDSLVQTAILKPRLIVRESCGTIS
jgi:hypothetical protein